MDQVLTFVSQHPNLFPTTGLSWLQANWHVVQAFEREALAVIAAGRTHYSARTIVENLVHQSVVREREGVFKIGNHHAPDLARVFVVLHPEWVDFFEYRRDNAAEFKQAIAGFQEFSFLY